jgi:hypothetical protein
MSRLLKCPQREITDVNEKAFQRAIFHNAKAFIPPKKGKRKNAVISWYAFESPIDKDRESNSIKRGKNNVDLIGKDIVNNHYIVCEVKFSCNKKDSPEHAAKEALHYYNVITADAIQLDKVATHHSGETMFFWQDLDENSEIWVVANSAYWTYWLGCKKMKVPEYAEENGIRKTVRCFSLDIPGDYFTIQKGDNKLYAPEIPQSVEWTELTV